MYVYIYVITLIFVYTKCSSLEGGLNVVKLGGDYSICHFQCPYLYYIYNTVNKNDMKVVFISTRCCIAIL